MNQETYNFIQQQLWSIQNLHKNLDIDEEYKTLSLHIALERADAYKDKQTFNKILNIAPDILKHHIELTKPIFTWNFY